jgi:hypothetical protein
MRMARFNISIPDGLRAEMEALNEQLGQGGDSVNWSAVAQTAFAHVVEVEGLKRVNNDLEAGLLRLRANKNQHVEREHAIGMSHGYHWALEEASYDDLHEAMTGLDVVQAPDRAIKWVNARLDRMSFDLPGMPKSDVSEAYCRGFLDAAKELFSKV